MNSGTHETERLLGRRQKAVLLLLHRIFRPGFYGTGPVALSRNKDVLMTVEKMGELGSALGQFLSGSRRCFSRAPTFRLLVPPVRGLPRDVPHNGAAADRLDACR